MRKLILLLLLLFPLFNTSLQARNTEIVFFNKVVNDTINYKNTGEYYPYFKLSKDDSLKLPLKYDLELYLNKIEDFDIKNNYFYAVYDIAAYSKFDTIYISKNNDRINNYPSDRIRLDYKSADESYISDWYYDGLIEGEMNDSIEFKHYQYTAYIENTFLHNWNLKNYPFDTQELEIRYISSEDSSLVKLSQSKAFESSFNEKMRTLKQGYNIRKIVTINEYIEGASYVDVSPGIERKVVFDHLVFKIIIDRDGSFLYFKLFLGTFLSFLISYLVFFIPIKDFESRMTLSVGGIFGAVGNRYFVESFMSGVQVLTKADLINNLIILLIVMNIIIVIAQHNKKINFGLLEKNRYSAIFSAFLFIISNLIIIYM